MIQDVGSEFGPKKADLDQWRSKPVWQDAATCLVSMKGMPYNGGTFEDVAISEGGRRLLGDRLRQLSAKQIETLFTAAGFEDVPCMDRGVSGSREADRRAAGVPGYGEDRVLTIFPLSTDFSQPIHRAKIQRVAGDLDEHEAQIAIVPLRLIRGRPQVANAHRTGRPDDEVHHAALRCHPFVHMLVTGRTRRRPGARSAPARASSGAPPTTSA